MEFLSTLIMCYVSWTVMCDKTASMLCTLDSVTGLID
jgi:hypothetical protein